VTKRHDVRPVFLFLDIDCVINAPGAGMVWPAAVTVSRTFETRETPFRREHITVTFAPVLIKALDKIRRDFAVNLVWHSTWVETPESVVKFTNMVGGLYGGDMVASPKATSTGYYPAGWKGRHIRKYLAGRGPADFIVLDDELPKWRDTLDEFAENGNVRFLPIAPPEDWRAGTGVTPEHIAAIRAFLTADINQQA